MPPQLHEASVNERGSTRPPHALSLAAETKRETEKELETWGAGGEKTPPPMLEVRGSSLVQTRGGQGSVQSRDLKLCCHLATNERPEGQCSRQREQLVPRPGGEKEPAGGKEFSVAAVRRMRKEQRPMGWSRGHRPDPQGLSISCGECGNEEGQSVEGCDQTAAWKFPLASE